MVHNHNWIFGRCHVNIITPACTLSKTTRDACIYVHTCASYMQLPRSRPLAVAYRIVLLCRNDFILKSLRAVRSEASDTRRLQRTHVMKLCMYNGVRVRS